MTFGKPGRPQEDRLLRQREIYEAVAPLLLTVGARRLSMRQAAQAAHMSIGGLYHYFPNKVSLALHGLDLDARTRICVEYRARMMDIVALGIQGYVDSYLDHSVRMITFVRPSVHAALDLGVMEFRAALDSGLNANVGELKDSLYLLMPDADDALLEGLARAIRRTAYGFILEAQFDPAELREQLHALIDGYMARTQTPLATVMMAG